MTGQTNASWDINSIYEQLINYTMLYDGSLGDTELNECKDGPSGGWTSTYYYSRTNSYWNRNINNLEAGVTTRRASTANWRTTNTIDFSNYSYAGVVVKTTAYANRNVIYATVNTNGYGNATGDKRFTEVNRTENKNYLEIFDASKIEDGQKRYISVYHNADDSAFAYYIYLVGLFNKDDWETLAIKAGITATSIDDIIINSTTLLSNKDAVEFMIKQCTGDFMINAIHSSTFLTALNNSPYKTKILANEHWSKFLTLIS